MADDGSLVATANRVRHEVDRPAGATTHTFRRVSPWRHEEELHVGGQRVGSINRTSVWGGDAVADLPGLPALIAVFALAVVLTSGTSPPPRPDPTRYVVRTRHVPREPRVDAQDPRALGRFWEGCSAASTLTDEPGLFETRLTVPDGLVLDLCFQSVPEPRDPDPRLHLDVSGGARQAEVVQRALELGARHLDIGQRDVPWVVLADPEGNPFCVMEERAEYATSGPIAALPLDSADPARDAAFWAELSGWQPVFSAMPAALRHPSRPRVLLELCPEPGPKAAGSKNRLHLDIRLEAGDDEHDVVARVVELGGHERRPRLG